MENRQKLKSMLAQNFIVEWHLRLTQHLRQLCYDCYIVVGTYFQFMQHFCLLCRFYKKIYNNRYMHNKWLFHEYSLHTKSFSTKVRLHFMCLQFQRSKNTSYSDFTLSPRCPLDSPGPYVFSSKTVHEQMEISWIKSRSISTIKKFL